MPFLYFQLNSNILYVYILLVIYLAFGPEIIYIIWLNLHKSLGGQERGEVFLFKMRGD